MEFISTLTPVLKDLNPIFLQCLITFITLFGFIIALKKCGLVDTYFERQDKAQREYEEKQAKKEEEARAERQREKDELRQDIYDALTPIKKSIEEIESRLDIAEKDTKEYQEHSREFHEELRAFAKDSNYNDWLLLRDRLIELQRKAFYAKDSKGEADPHTSEDCMLIYNQLFERYKQIVTDPQMLAMDEVIRNDSKIRSLECRKGLFF